MKNIVFPLIGIISLSFAISCNDVDNNQDVTAEKNKNNLYVLAKKDNFNDTLNNKAISIYYLKNTGIEAAITNYGGRVVNLLVPDKDGKMTDVVVGFDSFKGFYESKEPYFGATVGRYGNRIAKGKFILDGVEYSLNVNNGPNTLHGGTEGFHNVVWDAKQLNDSSLQLSYLSKSGEMGFPGSLTVKVLFSLTANQEMKINYEATTDKKTICNLTNHTFFNLNGGGTINNHLLMINAEKYTPVDSTLIPLGKNEPVANTPFDFTKATTIGARVDEENVQLGFGKGYDHNFVINGEMGSMRMATEVKGDKSGIVMQIFSIEPGLQFYGGNFMKSRNNLKGGGKDDFRTGFCLEPQHFPDSPNQSEFPSTILNAGEVYKTETIYKFY